MQEKWIHLINTNTPDIHRLPIGFFHFVFLLSQTQKVNMSIGKYIQMSSKFKYIWKPFPILNISVIYSYYIYVNWV